jgi:hypothetical protein
MSRKDRTNKRIYKLTFASSGINGIVSILHRGSCPVSFCLSIINAISMGNANQTVCLYLSGTFNGGSAV